MNKNYTIHCPNCGHLVECQVVEDMGMGICSACEKYIEFPIKSFDDILEDNKDILIRLKHS